MLDCAGNCALKQCELAPEIAWRINVEGVQNLLSQTVPRGARLVHLSCDLVFSGDDGRGGYVETDPTDPVTVYGRTMAAAEEVVLAADPTACILRISLPMGVSFSGHAGAIDWITSRFKKSRPATLYYDEIRTPTYTDCLNRLYERMLDRRAERHFSRRRAAAVEPLPDRADHQSRGRIRSELPDGHAASRGRPDPAAGRQRVHGLRQADRARWASTRSTRGPIAIRWCPRTPIGTASVRRTRLRSPAELQRVLAHARTLPGTSESRPAVHDRRRNPKLRQRAPRRIAQAPSGALKGLPAVLSCIGPNPGRADEEYHIVFGKRTAQFRMRREPVQDQIGHHRAGFLQLEAKSAGSVTPLHHQHVLVRQVAETMRRHVLAPPSVVTTSARTWCCRSRLAVSFPIAAILAPCMTRAFS